MMKRGKNEGEVGKGIGIEVAPETRDIVEDIEMNVEIEIGREEETLLRLMKNTKRRSMAGAEEIVKVAHQVTQIDLVHLHTSQDLAILKDLPVQTIQRTRTLPSLQT